MSFGLFRALEDQLPILSKVWIGIFSGISVDPSPNRTVKILQDNGFQFAPLQERLKLDMERGRFQSLGFPTKFHLGVKKSESCEKFLQVRCQNYSVDFEELKKAARDASEALHFGVEGKKLLEVLEMAWEKS
jgi:hypothetical protein